MTSISTDNLFNLLHRQYEFHHTARDNHEEGKNAYMMTFHDGAAEAAACAAINVAVALLIDAPDWALKEGRAYAYQALARQDTLREAGEGQARDSGPGHD